MKTLFHAVVLVLLFVAFPPSLLAQWASHPSPGIPKLADGKPNLTGPVPRTPDGKPDLSGIWENVRGFGGPGQRGEPPPPPPAGTPPVASFRDAGSGFAAAGIKEGLPLQPWAAELVKKRMADNSKDNPDAHCLPMGNMQFHTHGQPRKIIQTPGLIVIIFEPNSGLRQVFMDGRVLPKVNDDLQPFWYGYSVGRWEGDTLVVETTGFRDDGWLDINGNPLTGAGKTIERFRRVNFGTLEIDVTVDDPKAYTKPWTVRVNQRIMLDTELIEFICLENQRFVGR